MADNRTNVDIFSAIGEEEDEVVVSQERLSPDFPIDDLNADLLSQSLPEESLEAQVDGGGFSPTPTGGDFSDFATKSNIGPTGGTNISSGSRIGAGSATGVE